MTYEEYDALKSWLIQVGEDGEWPLFLDVWLEHVVEEVANADREGSKGTIEGPYYVPDAPSCPRPHRSDARRRAWHTAALPGPGHAPSTALRCRARSRSGTPTTSASTPSSPRASPSGTCAARVVADDEGRFAINTMQPAPYQIPTDGSCGRLIEAAGWHAWRPAHIHVKASAPGPPADHHPALLRGWRVHRHGHRRRRQARAHAGPDPAPDGRAPRSPTTSCSTPPEMALYAVRMDVDLPLDLPGRDELLAREKAYCQDLQRSGQWVHIWRITGRYSNLSIFEVADNEALHEVLWGLPLFPYMAVDVIPLGQHPSAV